MTPHELLAGVDGWLRTLAGRYARRHGLDADDVYQAAALRVLSAAGRYDPAKGRPTTWAAWQILHAASCLLRERERFGRAALRPPEILAAVPTRAVADDPPYLDHLARALECLTERQRQVLELRHADRHTLAEVGEKFGFTRERARQIEKRAVGRLRTAILARAHPAA